VNGRLGSLTGKKGLKGFDSSCVDGLFRELADLLMLRQDHSNGLPAGALLVLLCERAK